MQSPASLCPEHAEQERLMFARALGSPEILRTIIVSTGEVVVHRIPPHLVKRRKRR